MSQSINVKVEYVQGPLYIVIYGIFRWCQSAIPIFDILIGFGVMAERLNPYDGIFRVLGFSTPPPRPHRQKFEIISR